MPEARVIPHLVGVEELLSLMGHPDVRIVDVRWRLGDPTAGPTAFARGHIPGAVFADVDQMKGLMAIEAGFHVRNVAFLDFLLGLLHELQKCGRVLFTHERLSKDEE